MIKVVVSGKVGEGKSTVANIIATALLRSGYGVYPIKDVSQITEMRESVDRALDFGKRGKEKENNKLREVEIEVICEEEKAEKT